MGYYEQIGEANRAARAGARRRNSMVRKIGRQIALAALVLSGWLLVLLSYLHC